MQRPRYSPNWSKNYAHNFDWANISDELYQELFDDALLHEAEVKAYNDYKKEQQAICLAAAKEAFGANGLVHRYLLRQHVPLASCFTAADFKRKVEQSKYDAQQARTAAAIEKGREAYKTRAINWLIARGLVLGQDFTLETATQKAENIGYELAIAAQIAEAEAGGGPYSFDFDGTCEDECSGWSGIPEQRCYCGNRRVDWHAYGDFERPAVDAEAY